MYDINIVNNILCACAGGAIGSALRYAISLGCIHSRLSSSYATFTVNIAGAFIIGLVFAYISIHSIPETLRVFLMVGILGGFTTFSSFSLEAVNMLRNEEYASATLYILLSNVLGILSAMTAILLGNKLFKL